jgi:aminoglycoside phosphotransferase (APT) family kinase protein
LNWPSAAALALVPGLERGAAPIVLERLPAGTINDTYRVDTTAGRFVLRVDGAAWRRPGVDRDREAILHAAAAAAGLAPRIVRRHPECGVFITEFVPGVMWTPADFADAGNVALLGERLAVLHGLALPPLQSFDPLSLAVHYASIARPGSRSASERVLAALRIALQRLAPGERPACIVHGDLIHTNLLQGERLWLLDFEYAQWADPVYDMGCVLAYYPAARRHADLLLAAAGLDARVHREEIDAAIYVYRAMTWLWHQARGEEAEEP